MRHTRPTASRPGSASTPLALRDVLEPGDDKHQGAPAVGEDADHPRSPADLVVQALGGVVGPDPCPVLTEEPRVGQSLGIVRRPAFKW